MGRGARVRSGSVTGMPGPQVVVVDHHDSYTWNLVHLVAAVTGELPVVVEHDEVTAEALRDKGFSHIVLSPGPGRPGRPAGLLARPAGLRAGAAGPRRVPRDAGDGHRSRRHGRRSTSPRTARCHRSTTTAKACSARCRRAFHAVRYHSLQATTLPDCLVPTASCPGALEGGPRALMGVRHVSLPLEGVQFHPESILTEHGERLVRNFLVPA